MANVLTGTELTSAHIGGNARFGTSATTDTDNSFYFRTSGNGHTSNSTSAYINTSTEGSSTAFALVNPGIVMNYIIKL